ncbi:MAG: TetR/AcrR family transcriptional regulator [Bacteroides sp.]|nr:TetR/AcrR family transcriptional regulator [Bacteroides sp.]
MGENSKHTTSRAELKQRIIRVSLHYFQDRGIKAITMDEIATSLGISKRTLYEVFADKEALLMACLQHSQEEGEQYIYKVYKEARNVLEVILSVFQFSIRRVHETNKKFFEEIKKYPSAHEMLRRRSNSDNEKTIAFFRQGVEQGVFRSDVNFAIVTVLVKEQMNLLVNSDLCKEYSFLEVYESIMFTFLRGISTAKGAQELEAFIREYRSNNE